jgi:hypothetical protein
MRKAVCLLTLLCLAGCSDPEKDRIKKTTVPTYDKKTGKLTELTHDMNKNGRIDTWVAMNGALPVSAKADLNEDGTLDRWEYYDQQGKLTKVGFSRTDAGKPDSWAFSGRDGKVQRIEISSTADDKKIDRWEHYQADVLVRAEDDTNQDGSVDKWSLYEGGALKTAAFDENGDGRPDRRLTYSGTDLLIIETEPDSSGTYQKRIEVKK